MESLHLPTMVVLILFIQVLSCVTMLATWLIDRQMPGIGVWSLGSLANVLAFAIYANLTTASSELHVEVVAVDALRIFAAATALVGALLLRGFLMPLRKAAWAAICVAILGLCWLVNLDIRLGIVVPDMLSAVLATFAAGTLIWRNTSDTERKVYGITAFFIFLAGMAFGARALQALAVPEEAQLETFSYAAMPFAVMLISIAGWTCGVIMACYYRAQARLAAMAREDALTGLPNRRGIEEALSRQQAVAEREGAGFGIILIDLNRFKQVNDLYGHACGDALLQELGRRLRAFVRDADTAGRLGGDEFLLIMPGVRDRDAMQSTLTRLRRSVDGQLQLQGHEVSLSISAGGALWPEDGRSADALMNHADKAMYDFKRARGVQRDTAPAQIFSGT